MLNFIKSAISMEAEEEAGASAWEQRVLAWWLKEELVAAVAERC